MFSGIITDVGTVSVLNKDTDDWKVEIKTVLDANKISIGDSISCDGICLTVIEISHDSFITQISSETRRVTNVNYWDLGYKVNLEKSLRVGDLLNGHFVQGHVDCHTEVLEIEKDGDSHKIRFILPKQLNQYITYKCSITINGISLTVNKVSKIFFEVNIVPHTWDNTNLSHISIGSKVNVEVDLIARYLEKLYTK
jgi:riboflavin synthase